MVRGWGVPWVQGGAPPRRERRQHGGPTCGRYPYQSWNNHKYISNFFDRLLKRTVAYVLTYSIASAYDEEKGCKESIQILHENLPWDIGARIYRPSFRENKPKTLVFHYWKCLFWACFHENWVYKFGHGALRFHSFYVVEEYAKGYCHTLIPLSELF